MCLVAHVAITFVVGIVILCVVCYFSGFKKYKKCYQGDATDVLKIVESLLKVCPLGPRNQWTLLDQSLPRCWKHITPLGFWGFRVEIYGSCVIVNGSSFATFKMIENLENWLEWNPKAAKQQFSLHQLDNIEFKEDDYIDNAKVVSQDGKTEYFRFSHLGPNELGWILLWNVKKLSWWWFSLQPLHDYELSRCMMTCICGSSCEAIRKQLSFISSAIKEAVEINSVYSIPFSQTSEYGISDCSPSNISSHHVPRSSSPIKPFKELINSASLQLVPCIDHQYFWGRRIREFSLLCSSSVQKDLPKTTASEKSSQLNSPTKSTHTTRNKRSSTPDKAKLPIRADKYCQSKRSQSFIHMLPVKASTHHHARRTKTITAVMDDKGKSNLHARWFSETSLNVKHGSLDKHSLEELPEEEDGGAVSESAISNNTDEAFFNKTMPEKTINNYFMQEDRNASDYEILLPNLELTDHRLADLLTKGNYSASQLQAEVLSAANMSPQMFDADAGISNNIWSYHAFHKGVTLLSKVSEHESLKIMSYLCEVEIPLKACDVWKVIRCPHLRFLYDETVKRVRILEELSKHLKIIHTYHETGNLLKNEAVDFCLLHTERQENSKYYLAISSLEYANCPLMNDATRGTLLPSGWVVEPHLCSEEKSKLTYLYQVVVNKPSSLFLHDLGNSLVVSISNLKNYILLNPAYP